MLLGCIGDDFTGSSDLANMLAKSGMKTIQYCGVPDGPADASVEAGVVALKSRTIPVADAVRQSLEAVEWLLEQRTADLFQILLDIRFNARRQYRPRHRRADGASWRGADGGLPGLSGDGADGLSGASLRQ